MAKCGGLFWKFLLKFFENEAVNMIFAESWSLKLSWFQKWVYLLNFELIHKTGKFLGAGRYSEGL